MSTNTDDLGRLTFRCCVSTGGADDQVQDVAVRRAAAPSPRSASPGKARPTASATKRARVVAGATLVGAALALAACSTGSEHASQHSSAMTSGHGGMEHPADGGPVPAGMKRAADPAYPRGSTVVLTADHVDGMAGATATIVGAYDTYTYAVDYTPTDGADPVKDHRWVVQEEMKDAGAQRLPDGAEVTLLADHMPGMKGAKATVVSSTDETVYVVDYKAHGMTMTNHKWVTESEITPQP